jgi:hypothetical protein
VLRRTLTRAKTEAHNPAPALFGGSHGIHLCGAHT